MPSALDGVGEGRRIESRPERSRRASSQVGATHSFLRPCCYRFDERDFAKPRRAKRTYAAPLPLLRQRRARARSYPPSPPLVSLSAPPWFARPRLRTSFHRSVIVPSRFATLPPLPEMPDTAPTSHPARSTSSPSPLAGVQAVLFDQFGTLTNWQDSVVRSLADAAEVGDAGSSGAGGGEGTHCVLGPCWRPCGLRGRGVLTASSNRLPGRLARLCSTLEGRVHGPHVSRLPARLFGSLRPGTTVKG